MTHSRSLSLSLTLSPCPCRIRENPKNPEKTPLLYKDCCKPLHQAIQNIEDSQHLTSANVEQIMRSRYSAFVLALELKLKLELKLLDYLLATTYFENDALFKKAQLKIELEAQFNNKIKTHWQGLNIISVDHILQQVEFKAYYKFNGRAFCLHERSQFMKSENGYFAYAPESSKLFSQ